MGTPAVKRGWRKDDGYSYHIRLAVIIPTFPEVSHIYAGVKPETEVDGCQCLQVHRTTTTNSTSQP